MSKLDIFLNDLKIFSIGLILLVLGFLVFSFLNAIAFDTITQPGKGLCSFFGDHDTNFTPRIVSGDTDCYFGTEKYLRDRTLAGFFLSPLTVIFLIPISFYYSTLKDRDKQQNKRRKRK